MNWTRFGRLLAVMGAIGLLAGFCWHQSADTSSEVYKTFFADEAQRDEDLRIRRGLSHYTDLGAIAGGAEIKQGRNDRRTEGRYAMMVFIGVAALGLAISSSATGAPAQSSSVRRKAR